MITVGNILKWCNEYDGPLFHSAFLDPPYHLGEKDKESSGGSGFMGQEWDSGDIAFQPETWAAIGRHLHYGSFNFAFAGTRGYHRMACAIEDAGFIIHPLIIWANKQGFPKAQRVDTQIDQAAGEKVKKGKSFNYKGSAGGTHREHENWDERTRVQHDAITDQAKQWEGHRYGLQALRPMLEPICVFQKPFPDKKTKIKPYQSIVNTGAGTLNIDGAWIQTGKGYSRDNSVGQNGTFNASGGRVESEGGHWPANMIIDDEYAAELDDHTAEQFYVASRIYEQIEDADPVVFVAKASISEKEAGLDSMQRRIMVGEDDFEDGRLNDGRQADSERPYLRNKVVRRNIHATVKPIALTRHLATLLLPPEGYQRRLLVPFSGVGSEMIGAMLAGWDYVQGIELVPLHAKIARVRLNYWMQWRGMPDLKPKIVREKRVKDGDDHASDVAQTTLF